MEEKKLTTEEKETVQALAQSFIKTLGIDGEAAVEENEGGLSVLLETQDTGIVIGYHGEVLEALQLILSLIVAKKLDRYVRITVEVGDYRKNREDYLQQLATRMKEKVLDQQREQVITSLKPWERRVIHLFLQDDKDVVSESSGEGRERVLVIRPR